ncbi:MAG: tetratricopeptide repeat protein [Betaproteobacteria bacterium]|nr:tetratricopeptide repeat protein [Betaproteobacteria bacterium]
MPLFLHFFPPNSMTWVSRSKLFLLCVFVLVGAASVQAQTVTQQTYKGTPHDEVQKSMMRRDWNNALWITEEYLQEQPRDPQMRFWRARLLEQLKRNDEAFDTYLELSREYPELAEVQNNLGVMLAAQGRMDEARQAFENALRNNPDYAIAHENLGDILMHLAQRSYDKAIRLRGADKSLKQKTTALQPALQLTLNPP